MIAQLGQDTGLCADGVWVADSISVECGRSRETVHRSNLVGFAETGYWRLALPLVPRIAPASVV